MTTKTKFTGTRKQWEDGTLGNDENFVRVSSQEDQQALDDALDLKPISIRLQKTLIEKLKFIAAHHGIGYQPMVRDILSRFTRNELLYLTRQIQEQNQLEDTLSDENSPYARHTRDCA